MTIIEVEAAISSYATAHPKSIVIAHRSGYQDVYLSGEWPATITLNALAGDSTVIIIVNEYGQQTTINANETVTSSGDSASGSGTNSGSDNNGGGSGDDNGDDNGEAQQN